MALRVRTRTSFPTLRVGLCLFWACAGATTAFAGLGDVNADARVLVTLASIIGPAAAFVAVFMLINHRRVWAGVALVVSLITPTYYAWPLSVLPVFVLALLVLDAPRARRAHL